MKQLSFANRWNADLIDEYYDRWLTNPEGLDEKWIAFFEGFELATNGNGSSTPNVRDSEATAAIKQARFTGAIYAYRSIGHTMANFNPLEKSVAFNPRLSLQRLGFEDNELDREYHTGNYLDGKVMSIGQLLNDLKETYCSAIGVEYLHIQDTPPRRWLQARIEPTLNKSNFSREKKLAVLEDILEAEGFEKYLQTRYVGQKRFSLEGGETIIPCLHAAIEKCFDLKIVEIVMGMAHRGRLNVLANILGKSYDFIFHEFAENYVPETIHGDGDVKYHLGYEAQLNTSSGETINFHLAANPSHLEVVNPVVEGRARARQRILGDLERKKVLPILIHGDAAFAGQGVVSEVLNLSQLKGYTTGGTLHLIINNQIGFTTDPSEARSSRYCTDVAKMIEAPIFHVNGDDPLAMVYVTEMALDYRQEFGQDVVIDMYCYRRHGHNESDEPTFTQPLLYERISKHPLISETLCAKLIEEGELEEIEAEAIKEKYQKTLDAAFNRTKKEESEIAEKKNEKFHGSDAIFQPPYSFRPVKTSVRIEALEKVIKALSTYPEDLKLNRKIIRLLSNRRKAYEQDLGIDWALAEQLAWGTLMLDGTPVRISGQDCARGTFSQRHAVLYDVETKEGYFPLMELEDRRAIQCVHNSMLSEVAVLGFDYGYSLDYPQMLCMWEAQFGDFVNGAQVIIDQFIASAESKWQRVSGIVLLLPHGYEGQGPEHSSARLERFLQACAEDNFQVCNLSTPAQYFHVLRRQMKRDIRMPLIIMAPKSLLRHKQAVSQNNDFLKGTFKEILDDSKPGKKIERIILSTGKIFYDLNDYRTNNKIENAVLLRVEQLYPLNRKLLKELLTQYSDAKKLVWCQEESQNMGAWTYIAPILEEISGEKPFYAGRDASASPAVGSLAIHKIEQAALVETAFLG